MPQRIRRNEIDNVFGPNQNQPIGEIEITPDLRQAFPVFNEPALGTGGTRRPPLPSQAGQAPTRGRMERFREGAGRVGDILAQPEVGSIVGRFAEAFGQGDPTSAATILGQGAQAVSSEAAQGEIARRLLSGEDISDIPAETLAAAGPEAREQIIQVAEQRADREQRGEDMEMRERLQERALDLQGRGLDLRAFGLLTERDALDASLDADEIGRRLDIAETSNEINQQLADSLGRLRNAQIQALTAEQEGRSVNPEAVMRETRELLDNLRRSMQVSQEQVDILRSDLERESGLATGEHTRTGTLLHQIGETISGRQVDPAQVRKMREPQNTEEYYQIRGRLEAAQEDLARQQELYDELARQQADMIRGVGQGQRQQGETPQQIQDREPLPTREQLQQSGATEPQTPQSVDEITAYEPGTVFEWQGRIMRKEGDDSFVDVTDQYRAD